jgi:hypothetical protein
MKKPPFKEITGNCRILLFEKEMLLLSIHEDSMSLLKNMYEECLTQGSYSIDRETYMNMDHLERKKLDSYIQYLRESYYIKPHTLCVGLPVSYTLTSDGIRQIEGINTTGGDTVYNIVHGDNYGITANTATGNTFNTGNSLADVITLIEKSVPSKAEQDELLDAISKLFDRIEKGYPIEKGLLSSVKGPLEKYQSIVAAIIPKVFDYLVSLK